MVNSNRKRQRPSEEEAVKANQPGEPTGWEALAQDQNGAVKHQGTVAYPYASL